MLNSIKHYLTGHHYSNQDQYSDYDDALRSSDVNWRQQRNDQVRSWLNDVNGAPHQDYEHQKKSSFWKRSKHRHYMEDQTKLFQNQPDRLNRVRSLSSFLNPQYDEPRRQRRNSLPGSQFFSSGNRPYGYMQEGIRNHVMYPFIDAMAGAATHAMSDLVGYNQYQQNGPHTYPYGNHNGSSNSGYMPHHRQYNPYPFYQDGPQSYYQSDPYFGRYGMPKDQRLMQPYDNFNGYYPYNHRSSLGRLFRS
ncbi:hypothetical protein A0J61_00275 [Choanephora cucurbitarum]|uniref:Uncharacterized protein n=1 Tax=Choanephora cucurbitarum TaxID=101091 RepID=A0A1C7NRF3_9FUNG|nr:hypothetical protein A0J61_00275 [Choanephora cucurbitarum]